MAAESTSVERYSGKLRLISCLTTSSGVGLLLGVALVITVAMVRNRDALTPLTTARFDEARRLWGETRVDDYDIEVRVTGRQPAIYYVEVREGQVQYASRNGDQLRQRRTMGTWSVDGMFETILSDVENAELHRTGKADRSTPQVLLRASFDPDLGYPLKYHRTELRKFGSNIDMMWRVTHFAPARD